LPHRAQPVIGEVPGGRAVALRDEVQPVQVEDGLGGATTSWPSRQQDSAPTPWGNDLYPVLGPVAIAHSKNSQASTGEDGSTGLIVALLGRNERCTRD